MADFDPKYAALMGKARMAFEALETFKEVLEVLENKVISDGVQAYRTGGLTPESAQRGFIEIAAYRNLKRELEQRVDSGKKAEIRALRELQS